MAWAGSIPALSPDLTMTRTAAGSFASKLTIWKSAHKLGLHFWSYCPRFETSVLGSFVVVYIQRNQHATSSLRFLRMLGFTQMCSSVLRQLTQPWLVKSINMGLPVSHGHKKVLRNNLWNNWCLLAHFDNDGYLALITGSTCCVARKKVVVGGWGQSIISDNAL